MKGLIARIVDASGRRPGLVALLALLAIVVTWGSASFLELHSDLLDLLPRESEGFKAYEHQVARMGGGASLIVVAESKDRASNERFVDALGGKLTEIVEKQRRCRRTCGADPGGCDRACGRELIDHFEVGTKDARAFFDRHKWLYADRDDLERAEDTLDHQIALGSGLVENLEDDADGRPSPAAAKTEKPQRGGGAKEADKKPALGLDGYAERWKAKAEGNDFFPAGYFETQDGTMAAVRIIASTSGMGDAGSDQLEAQIRGVVRDLNASSFHPTMQIGFAGDIPNAIEEKDSLVSDVVGATVITALLILGGIVFFFRSLLSLIVIAVPAFIGVGCAYTFALVRYGYVNTSGAFLGAIILGNGINYPIVLLARYREFRARGLPPDVARREAVWNAFRAELVGSLVASIAYGSLVITRFRGFNQFGMIGFVGMFLVWASMIPCVPAFIVLIERWQPRLPSWLRDHDPRVRADGSRGPLTQAIARWTERAPWVFVGLAVVASVVTFWPLPKYMADPWEYDFHKLGSRGTKVTGAGVWSNKADAVFGGKMNIAGARMIADSPEQVGLVKKQILENDAKDPEGRLVAAVATIDQFLPGTPREQRDKIEILDRIRERLTPGVLARLSDDERERVAAMRPPDDLRPVAAADLPELIKRRFQEKSGALGTVFYVQMRNDVSYSDGHVVLRIARTTDNVKLPDGNVAQTASRSTIYAEIIRSMGRDGPLATFASFAAVTLVVLLATRNLWGALAVLSSLVVGVTWTIGGAALADMKLNYLNFIALPITFGIGCEYPFNVYDRSRLLGGDVTAAVRRTGGAVALCSYTTVIGYSALAFADNQALQSFGHLAMSGEIACLLSALLFLPSVLHLLKRLPKGAAHAFRLEDGSVHGADSVAATGPTPGETKVG